MPSALAFVALAAPASEEAAEKVESCRTGPLVLIAGGGSGGHVFPALAVAEELRRRAWRIAMVGAASGMEERLAKERGLPFYSLTARPVVGRGVVGKFTAALVLARSALQAVSLIRRLDPKLVLGTGGYVSVPAALGAVLTRRPLLLLEPNAHVGLANRWLSRFAAGAVSAHPESGAELRCQSWVTGVPVGADFFEQPELPALDRGARILVLGGSQGALQLNRQLPELLLLALGGRGGSVLHQTGAAHLDETVAIYRSLMSEAVFSKVETSEVGISEESSVGPKGARLSTTRVCIEVTPFIDDVADAMGKSHLVISRAGAVTLAEICAAGRPCLLIPLPIAAGHQQANAKALERAGAALLVEQARLQEVLPELKAVLADHRRLVSMSRQARSLGSPKAAFEIARRVVVLSGEKAA